MPKIKFYDHLTFYLSSLQKSVDKCANPGGRGSKTSVTVGQNQSFYKIRLILILGMELKIQVIWTTRCKVMAKYRVLFFNWLSVRLHSKSDQKSLSVRIYLSKKTRDF